MKDKSLIFFFVICQALANNNRRVGNKVNNQNSQLASKGPWNFYRAGIPYFFLLTSCTMQFNFNKWYFLVGNIFKVSMQNCLASPLNFSIFQKRKTYRWRPYYGFWSILSLRFFCALYKTILAWLLQSWFYDHCNRQL